MLEYDPIEFIWTHRYESTLVVSYRGGNGLQLDIVSCIRAHKPATWSPWRPKNVLPCTVCFWCMFSLYVLMYVFPCVFWCMFFPVCSPVCLYACFHSMFWCRAFLHSMFLMLFCLFACLVWVWVAVVALFYLFTFWAGMFSGVHMFLISPKATTSEIFTSLKAFYWSCVV